MSNRQLAKGIVVDLHDHGETSQRASLFFESLGARTIFYRGGKGSGKRSGSRSPIELFSQVEVEVKDAGVSDKPLTVYKVAVEKSHPEIRTNLFLFGLATLWGDLLRTLSNMEEEESAEIFRLTQALLNTWGDTAARWSSVENRTTEKCERLEEFAIAWLSVLDALGFAPQWSTCAISGRELPPAFPGQLTGYVTLTQGGRVAAASASGHQAASVHSMNPRTEITLQGWLMHQYSAEYLQTFAPDDGDSDVLQKAVGSFSISHPRDLELPFNFLVSWTRHHLDIKLRSYRFFCQQAFKKNNAALKKTDPKSED
jgi:recombinational DNA repair protein (RecF pathway)